MNNHNERYTDLKKEGAFVFPGDVITKLGKIKPGKGTIASNGEIIATMLGIVHYDRKNSFVIVESFKQPIFPKKNDLVLGEVISSGNSIANIKIWFMIKSSRRSKKLAIIPLAKPFSANLHISQVGMRTESLSKIIKIGDVVLGKVVMDYTLPVNIVINDKILGVVAASCSNCGAPLIYRNNGLYCKVCKKSEIRKVSALYDYEKFSFLFKIHKPKRYLIAELE